MAALAVEGGADPAPAGPGPAAGSRGATGRSPACSRCPEVDGWWRCCGCVLGLALLGACTGDPSPGPLMVGAGFHAAFTAPARDELQAAFWLAPMPEPESLAPDALRPPPIPVLRPRLAVVLPPSPPPRKPVAHDRIAWIPQPKPERRSPPEPQAALRHAIWPPPWKPDPTDRPFAIALAARPPEDPRSVLWPPPRKPADLPVAVAPAAGPPERLHSGIWPSPPKPDLPRVVELVVGPPQDLTRPIWPSPSKPDHGDLPGAMELAAAPPPHQSRPEGPVPIVVGRGHLGNPAIDDGITVSELDQLLPQLDRAAREALLADDPATALAIYERLAARFPDERNVWLGKAVALERLGRGGEARALYQAMLGADPEDLGAKIALLGILADLAPDEALRLLRRLAHHHPNDARLRAQMALVLARQGALSAALAEQRQAVTLAPTNLGYRINLAVLHDRAGGIDAAVEHYRSALELATLGGAPTAQLEAIAARLHHLRARQLPAAASAVR